MSMSGKNGYPLLHKLGWLDESSIKIRDKQKVEKSLSTLIEGSFKNLQIIADFDNTVTRFHLEGKRCDTSWGILDNSTTVTQKYRDEAQKLFKKYYPIEVDPCMKAEEKIPHIVDWYNRALQLLKEEKLEKNALEGLVEASNCYLRDNTKQLFAKLQSNDVPVLVFSAGMGDIVRQVLTHFHIYTDNVKVVSNFFKYDNNGTMIGFEGEMIHVFNKNENALHSSDYFDVLRNRNNVLLLGDSPGDAKMAEGVPDNSDVLKIGFLNDKIDANLDSFMKIFDIVLIDDQTMSVVNDIVSQLK